MLRCGGLCSSRAASDTVDVEICSSKAWAWTKLSFDSSMVAAGHFSHVLNDLVRSTYACQSPGVVRRRILLQVRPRLWRVEWRWRLNFLGSGQVGNIRIGFSLTLFLHAHVHISSPFLPCPIMAGILYGVLKDHDLCSEGTRTATGYSKCCVLLLSSRSNITPAISVGWILHQAVVLRFTALLDPQLSDSHSRI